MTSDLIGSARGASKSPLLEQFESRIASVNAVTRVGFVCEIVVS